MASVSQQKRFDDMAPAMALALQASFGSVERWCAAFGAMRDGSPATALVFQPQTGTLVNQHGPDPGGVTILVLEADASIDTIDWHSAYERYQLAVEAASEPFGATHDEAAGALLLDVRRAGVFEHALTRLPGARWLDPGAVEAWATSVPTDRDVVVYCVYGHEVGRSTTLRLRAAGVKARFLRGGIEGWQTAGRPLEPKEKSHEVGNS